MSDDHSSAEEEIARLKAALADARRIKNEFAELVKLMDETLARLNLSKTKGHSKPE